MHIQKIENIVIGLILIVFLSGCQDEYRENIHPNIVLILADDLGYGDVNCYYPDSKVKTPYLDQMASEGMRFTDAHSPSSVCTPTRYGILTGRYAWRTSLKKGVLWSWDPPLIEGGRLTLPQMLKNTGYSTAAIGKWHLGWEWPALDSLSTKETNGNNVDYSKAITGGPTEYGFDSYFGDDVPNFPPYTFIENDQVVDIPTVAKPDSMFGHPGMMAEGWRLDRVLPTITRKAVEFIQSREEQGNPFFLYFALTAPHTPIVPSPDFIGTSDAGAYGDYVQQVDWSVGQVLEALDRAGMHDNTMVIFTSDNGSPARNGDDQSGPVASVMEDYGHRANGDWRGLKGDAWEGGHRIPFIVRWPSCIESESVNRGLISSLDIMATIQEVLGAKIEGNASPDGQSFLKNLIDQKADARTSLVHHSHRGVFAIRKGDWKLILSDRSGGFSDGLHPDGYGIETPGQLYNLEDDPGEVNNLYDQIPERVSELKELLETIQEE